MRHSTFWICFQLPFFMLEHVLSNKALTVVRVQLHLPLTFMAGNTTDILGRLPLLWLVAGSKRWSWKQWGERHQVEKAIHMEIMEINIGCISLSTGSWGWNNLNLNASLALANQCCGSNARLSDAFQSIRSMQPWNQSQEETHSTKPAKCTTLLAGTWNF